MGEFVQYNRGRRMSGWVTAWLFGTILMTGLSAVEGGGYGETLEKGYCHCELDNYMVNVRSAVLQGQQPPPMPTSPPDSNATSTGTTTAGGTPTNSTATSGGNNTTTTTVAPGRRKREVAYIDDNVIEDVHTLMETPVDYHYSPRVKRAAAAGGPLAEQKDPLFSFITQQVEYTGVKSASDSGIMYDENGKISNCSCAPGSLVQLSICLLNLKYSNDLENDKSDKHKEVSYNLMYQLNFIMFKGLISHGGVNLFRRISLKSYAKRNDDGFTDALLDVLLTKKVYQAEYHVKNAIEPAVRGGELGPYITDAEKCVVTIDKTPPEPEKVHPLWFLKYLCLPVALAVLVVLVLCTCIGKKDAYYVRMW